MPIELKVNKRGSITVETILVISTILFVLCGLIFSFLLMYQKSMLTKTASLTAQQGAEIWTDSRKVIENGSMVYKQKLDFSENYYHIFNDISKSFKDTVDNNGKLKETTNLDSSKLRDKKLLQMRRAINDELKKGLLKPESTDIEVRFENILVQRKLEVILTQEIKIPLGGLKELFDGSKTVTLRATGVAVVSEPAEYIRNIDLGIEYAEKAAKKISEKVDLDSVIGKIKDKLVK